MVGTALCVQYRSVSKLISLILAIYKLILDKLFHFLVFTKIELKICEIMQNFYTQVHVFLSEGAMHHENSIPTGKI